MTEQNGTLEALSQNLAIAISPLAEALENPHALQDFIEKLGWQIPDTITTIGLDLGKIEAVFSALDDALELDLDTAHKSEIVAVYSVLVAAVIALIQHIYEASSHIDDHLDATLVSVTNIAEEFPKRLLDYLILIFLQVQHPAIFNILIVLGLAELREVSEDDPTFTSEHTRYILHYGRLGQLISDPTGLFHDIYGWGTDTADLNLLIERLYDFVLALGIPASLEYPEYEKEVNLSAPAVVPEEGEAEYPELRVPIVYTDDMAAAEAGITLLPVPPIVSGGAPGLALCPYATGSISEDVPIDDEGLWVLSLSASLDLVLGIGLLFRPNETLTVLTDIFGSSTSASGQLGVALARKSFEDERISLIGTSSGTGLTAKTIQGEVQLLVGTGQETDFAIEFALVNGRLRIVLDSVDSFLESGLPLDPIDILFDLGVGWSSRRGLYFKGGAGFEYSLSLHETIGPFKLDILHFGLKFDGSTIHTVMAITGVMQLGPLTATVEQIGMDLVLSFPSEGGNLGGADLAPTFKPPNGLGLYIDAAVVKGGGYLYFDFDREEYAGALELVFSEFLTLKAIGLITTRMPDGSKGFSLLVIITAEFGSPIQLSFGFTLSGVGGLLALNHTMRLQPLVEGVRTGAVNSVMFPTNVVENAPRIISDLRTFFPPQLEIFLIGPMAKIGWGTPSLVTLSLGIIIEIPGNIAILGILKVALPDEDAALLVLQVNFMGAIEFDKKRAWIFAGLYESRVLFITIEGQMGVLVAWGDNANFVVSVGGFHPAFNPPPLPFPEPNRIAVSILNTSFAKIRAEGYFAVTSNTVQFGARAELFFGVSAFKIDGHIAFDALFQFSPFYFIISISSSLGVKVFGIGLFSVRMRGSLEGPTPWHVEGTGSISLLFFDIDVDFSHTWGEEAETTLPPIQVMPLLKAEYEKLENWRAEVPAANNILVSLRKIETTEDIVLHPVGTLKISQRLAPLDLTIDKLGAQKPNDANYFTLSVDTEGVNAEDIEEIAAAEEMFAMPQFKDMADSKKLSSPAFEKQKGGVEVSAKGEQLKTTSAVKRVVRYEQIIIDSNFKRFVKPFFKLIGVLFNLFLNGSAITKSTLSNKYKKQKMPFADKIAVMPNAYAVAFNTDNAPFNEEAKAFTSYAQAEEFMNQKVKGDPNLQDSLHVIPEVEMKRAA